MTKLNLSKVADASAGETFKNKTRLIDYFYDSPVHGTKNDNLKLAELERYFVFEEQNSKSYTISEIREVPIAYKENRGGNHNSIYVEYSSMLFNRYFHHQQTKSIVLTSDEIEREVFGHNKYILSNEISDITKSTKIEAIEKRLIPKKYEISRAGIEKYKDEYNSKIYSIWDSALSSLCINGVIELSKVRITKNKKSDYIDKFYNIIGDSDNEWPDWRYLRLIDFLSMVDETGETTLKLQEALLDDTSLLMCFHANTVEKLTLLDFIVNVPIDAGIRSYLNIFKDISNENRLKSPRVLSNSEQSFYQGLENALKEHLDIQNRELNRNAVLRGKYYGYIENFNSLIGILSNKSAYKIDIIKDIDYTKEETKEAKNNLFSQIEIFMKNKIDEKIFDIELTPAGRLLVENFHTYLFAEYH